MTDVTSAELLMHCVPICLAASRETCVASYLQKMLSGCTFSPSLASVGCHNQPTLQQRISAGRMTNGKLVATMMLKNPNPVKLKHTKYCHCEESKCARGCSCGTANIKCVIACLCTGDPNKYSRVELVLDCSNSD